MGTRTRGTDAAPTPSTASVPGPLLFVKGPVEDALLLAERDTRAVASCIEAFVQRCIEKAALANHVSTSGVVIRTSSECPPDLMYLVSPSSREGTPSRPVELRLGLATDAEKSEGGFS